LTHTSRTGVEPPGRSRGRVVTTPLIRRANTPALSCPWSEAIPAGIRRPAVRRTAPPDRRAPSATSPHYYDRPSP
jgi:hypothetical protein